MSLPGENTGRLGLRSFRAKFVLVVGSAVLFDLLVTGGLALWNVQRLSRDAAAEVGRGLEEPTRTISAPMRQPRLPGSTCCSTRSTPMWAHWRAFSRSRSIGP